MEIATVYLKGGKNIEVPLEELEDYLYNNAEQIETRYHQLGRPEIIEEDNVTLTIENASTSSK